MGPANTEIKVTVKHEIVDHALDRLHLEPGKAESLMVFFAEDSGQGLEPDTRLLKQSVVLRARQRQGDRDDDCTIKIRPCRFSQLSPELLQLSTDEHSGVKVEADWAGDSRVLAASCTVDLPGHPLGDAVAQQTALSALFTRQQADFLKKVADIRVNLDMLTLLARPISALRWKPTRFPGATTTEKIRAERWTVGELDFLEFSIVAPIADADDQQARLTAFLEANGIHPPAKQTTKTQTVLRLLVGASVDPDA